MDKDELLEEVEAGVKAALDKIVKQQLEDMVKPENIDNLIERITETPAFRRKVNEMIDHWLPTEIGNRLRCGVYGHNFDLQKIFDAEWTPGLEKEIASRVRHKAYDALDTAIKERLESILADLKKSKWSL